MPFCCQRRTWSTRELLQLLVCIVNPVLSSIYAKTDNSLLFVLTIRSHNTCNRSINSPLPKQIEHIITCLHHSNIGAKRSTERNCPNFVRTSTRLHIWTTFVLHSFKRTLPQLRTNFALTSYGLRPNFAGKHNNCTYHILALLLFIYSTCGSH